MKNTNKVGIRHIKYKDYKILDGTEKYAEFFVKLKVIGMVYFQNGKPCRLEVIGSIDSRFEPKYEATLYFGGKAYSFTDIYNFSDAEAVEALAKRIGCTENSIWSINGVIEKLLINARNINILGHWGDELPNEVSIELESQETIGEYGTESEYSYSMKVGNRNIPVSLYTIDQGDFGFSESITFDLGDDKISVVYGNSDSLYTATGRENYRAIVKLEKLLGLKPGDGMKIIRKIGRV